MAARAKRLISIGMTLSFLALVLNRDLTEILVLVWTTYCSVWVLFKARNMSGAARRGFQTLGATGLIVLIGAAVRTVHGQSIGVDQPLPSPADFFHIPGYLLFFSIALQMHRARVRRRDIDAWVDSLAFSISLGAVLWGLFLGDFVLAADDSTLEITLHGGYNLILLCTFAVGLRIGATPGRRSAPYYLLGAGSAAFLIADLNVTLASITSQPPFLSIALSPAIYGLCAAAAAHPDAEQAFEPVDRAETEHSLLRHAFIVGSLVAPVVVVSVAESATPVVRATALGASILVAFLVAFRVTRLLGTEAATRRRERALGEELVSLATIPSVEQLRLSLPLSAARVVPSSFSLQDGEPEQKHEDVTSFRLPNSLRVADHQDSYLVAKPAFTTAQEKRLIGALVRDSGHIASALQVNAERERQRSEVAVAKQIAANERRFRALLQNSADTVAVFDRETGVVSFISESVERLLGFEPNEFIGKTLSWVTYPQDRAFAVQHLQSMPQDHNVRKQFELRAVHSDGSIRLLECTLADMRHVEGIGGMVMNATDGTAKQEMASNLLNAETTDPLTMVLNRNALIKEIAAASRRASVRGSSIALAVIDIDDFRSINDGYGNAIGDRVLVELSNRMQTVIRSDDAIARLAGDRFAVLFPSGYSVLEVEAVVERILTRVNDAISIDGHTVVLAATAGVCIDSEFTSDADTILSRADTALDIAKQAHRGEFLHFHSEMGIEASTRIEIRNRLRTAILDDQLSLSFQPLVDIESGEIVSMEALARWNDPVLGEISPGTFIPVAESSGLIVDLGAWAIRRACEHLSEWAELGFDNFNVSVNMSGYQLRDDRVVEQVQAILDDSGVDSSRITIELTESVLLDDTDFTAARIRNLRELGLKLAIDDFGTGYSSFGYLRRYDFDIIKIDRSFIKPLRDDGNTREREIVNAMIKLAQALGATTVAEGIEKSEEHAVLRTLGCDHAQGYFFFSPTEAAEIPDLLRGRVDVVLPEQ